MKSIHPLTEAVWVVFNCGDDWENYQNYTGQLTFCGDLTKGWGDENVECQGECKRSNECVGEVKKVIVYGDFCPNGLEFNYCQTAIEEDERRGFTVKIL